MGQGGSESRGSHIAWTNYTDVGCSGDELFNLALLGGVLQVSAVSMSSWLLLMSLGDDITAIRDLCSFVVNDPVMPPLRSLRWV